MKCKTGGRHLEATFPKIIENLPKIRGGYLAINAFNRAVKIDVSFTVTARMSRASDDYILEMYEIKE